MTTVGYGDFYPVSAMGRFVGIITALWGVVTVAVFVVSLSNLLNFSNGESKSFHLLERLIVKDELKQAAVNVLSAAYKKRKLKKIDPYNLSKRLSAFRELRKYNIEFQ